MASEGGPEVQYNMTSEGGPEAEFHNPRRQQLLEALQRALNVDISPTTWACLWLSDIDRLQRLISQAEMDPTFARSAFEAKSLDKMVPKCEFIKLIFNMDC